MALMSAIERFRCWAQYMRDLPGPFGSASKADIRAAVDAVDEWVENNQTSYNTALPQPFRNQATTLQKSLLLCYVVMRRVGRLRAEEDG